LCFWNRWRFQFFNHHLKVFLGCNHVHFQKTWD
jgi:hypothetical protein